VLHQCLDTMKLKLIAIILFFFSLEVLSIPGRTVVFIVVFVDEVS